MDIEMGPRLSTWPVWLKLLCRCKFSYALFSYALFEFINFFANDYPCLYIIYTHHDCPSQISSNLLISVAKLTHYHLIIFWGGWGCEVSCGGHHRPRGKTTTGSALDGAVFDITQILAYLVHNMSRSQWYLGFGHFGWLTSFFGQ